MLGKLDRFAGVVRTGTGHDGHALGSRFDAEFHDPFVLGMRQRRRFAGRPDRNEAAASLFDLPVDVSSESRLINIAGICERGDEGGNGSLEHAELPKAEIHASAAFFG